MKEQATHSEGEEEKEAIVAVQCSAVTKKGTQCTKMIKNGNTKCNVHMKEQATRSEGEEEKELTGLEVLTAMNAEVATVAVQCQAITKKGTQCTKMTKNGNDKCTTHMKEETKEEEREVDMDKCVSFVFKYKNYNLRQRMEIEDYGDFFEVVTTFHTLALTQQNWDMVKDDDELVTRLIGDNSLEEFEKGQMWEQLTFQHLVGEEFKVHSLHRLRADKYICLWE